MSVSLSNGVSITVSIDDVANKIDAATGKYIKSLSRSQKALGITIDELGRFVNANGKLVEGLTLSQIKMGHYVDELGTLHTENGGLVADLNKIEQALGFYADEWGVVYNAQHEVVRLTAENRKATADIIAQKEKEAKVEAEAERKKQIAIEKTIQKDNEEAEAEQRRIQMLGQAAGAVSQLTGQFASLLASLECTDDSVGGFRSSLIQVTEAVSVGFGTFQSFYLGISNIAKVLPAIKTGLATTAAVSVPTSANLIGVGTAATTASVGMKALQVACGPVGIAVAAIGAAVTAFATTNHIATTENFTLSDSFQELEKRAKAAGDSIKTVGDALRYGAFYKVGNELDEAQKKIDSAQGKIDNIAKKWGLFKDVEKARKDGVSNEELLGSLLDEYKSSFWGSSLGTIEEHNSAREAFAEYNNAMADYNSVAQKLMDAIRDEEKTEEQKADELKSQYETLKSFAKTPEDVALIERKIQRIDEEIAARKEKELADQKADLEKTLGIQLNFSEVQEQEKRMAQAFQRAADRIKNSGMGLVDTERAIDEAGERLKKDFSVPGLGDALEALRKFYRGATEFGSLDALANAEEEIRKEFEIPGLHEALEYLRDNFKEDGTGLIKTREEFLDAQKRIWEKYSDAYLSDQIKNLSEQFKNAETKDDVERLRKELAELNKKAGVDDIEYNKLLNQATEKEKEILEAQIGAVPGLKELISANKAAKSAVDYQKEALDRAGNYLWDDLFDEGDVFDSEQFKFLSANKGGVLDDAMKEYVDALNSAAEGLKEGAIDQLLHDDLVADANKKLAAAIDESAQKFREDARSELGIDALLEEIKTPYDKYAETLDKINRAVEAQHIDEIEEGLLVQQAQEKLAEAYAKEAEELDKSEDDRMKKAWERAQKDAQKLEKKAEPSKSMSGGSEAIYLAQVKNSTANFQSKVQSTTESIYKASQESLWESRQTNQYLQELVAGSPSVFG